ncbi:MAG: DsbA family oxidoreductase [Chloroflexi bacterium]|nr:DsbA family oxidoreductase [Chloroflexota bacterium]
MAELQRQHPVELVWLPFELRPEPEPLPDLTGPDLARYQANWARGVAPLAARYGVEMRFPPFKPRSRWAHEAAEFARDRGRFDAMRVALFQAYFVDNRDIGAPEVLAEVAERVGLDGAALRTALAEGTYRGRVVQLEHIAHQLGISLVPTMVFGDHIAVHGAQPYSVLREAYDLACRELAKAGEAPE